MNYPRAIGMAILTYLASMLVGMLTNIIFKVDPSTMPSELPTHLWIISAIVLVGITYLFATWYFKGKAVVASTKNGLLLGVIMLLVGFVLDMVFLQMYAMSPQAPADYNPFEIYHNVRFWVSVVVMIGTNVYVGRKSAN